MTIHIGDKDYPYWRRSFWEAIETQHLTGIQETKKAHILVRHEVSSYAAWKKIFDSLEETRKASEELSYQVLQHEEDGDNLTLMLEWDGLEKAKSFMESPRLKEEMAKSGVAEAPEIHFLSELDKGNIQGCRW